MTIQAVYEVMTSWYAVEVYNNREGKLSALLESRGIHPFAPTKIEQKMRGDKLVTKKVLLVPGYFFISCTEIEYEGLKKERPSGMISIQGPVAEEEIQRFRVESPKDEHPHRISVPVFNPGAQIRILRGSFTNLTGVFSHGEDERAIVQIPLFGRPTLTELSIWDIEVV